jgi:signal transduction histidine kinase
VGNYRQWIVDVGPALAVMALLTASVEFAPGRHPPVLGYVLLIAVCLSIALRRFAPVVVLLFSAACTFTVYVIDRPDVAVAIPVLCALFAAVRAGHRVIGAITGIAYLAGLVVVNVGMVPGHPTREDLQARILLLGWFVAAFVLAEVARLRARRDADIARQYEETLQRKAGEERLRIARELHDSLTHCISVIKVQAGVAVHLALKRGEEPSGALLAIQEASRDAMRELRETLEVLRDEPDISGLDRLDDLVERARSTGLPVDVTISGQRRELPENVDRAAYRIVQEALTNVARHARASSAAVHLGFGSVELTVQIDDDGRATTAENPVPGVGLIGMRERIAALGGELSASPRAGGGFRVRAHLPVS